MAELKGSNMKNQTLNNSAIIFFGVIILALFFNFLTARNYNRSNREVASRLADSRYYNYASLYRELEGDFPGDDYLVIDLRSTGEFIKGHIPGAVNIPAEKILERKLKKLTGKNSKILLYAVSEEKSAGARVLLMGKGYDNVSIIPGGYLSVRERVLDGFDPSHAFYNEDKAAWEYQRFMPLGKRTEAEEGSPEPEVPTPVIGGC